MYFMYHFIVDWIRFTNIKSPAIRRELHVPPGYEDKRLLTLHFHAGGGQDRGFLIKLTGGVLINY